MGKKKSKIGSRGVGPMSMGEDFTRDYGQFSIAKIHGVYEDLGLVVGELDKNVMGAIPIEWFTKDRGGEWRPNGLACPYIYMENKRQEAIDKYNEIEEQIKEVKDGETKKDDTGV